MNDTVILPFIMINGSEMDVSADVDWQVEHLRVLRRLLEVQMKVCYFRVRV